MARKSIVAIICLMALLAFLGCGGGGGGGVGGSSTNSAFLTRTTLSVPIDWSGGNAQSVVVTAANSKADGSSLNWVINRGTDQGLKTYRSTDQIFSGALNIGIAFFDQRNGKGNVLGQANTLVNTDKQGGGTPPIKLSTSVDSATLPLSQNVEVGRATPVLLTAFSGTSLAALMPGSFKVTVVQGSDVIQVNPDGSLQAMKVGQAEVRVTVGNVITNSSMVASRQATGGLESVYGFFMDDVYPWQAPGLGAPQIQQVVEVGSSFTSKTAVTCLGNWPSPIPVTWTGAIYTLQVASNYSMALYPYTDALQIVPDASSTEDHPAAQIKVLRTPKDSLIAYWQATAIIDNSPRTVSGRIGVHPQNIVGSWSATQSNTGQTHLDSLSLVQWGGRDSVVDLDNVYSDDWNSAYGVAMYTLDGVAKTTHVKVTFDAFTRAPGAGGVDPSLGSGEEVFGNVEISPDAYYVNSDPPQGDGINFQGAAPNAAAGDFSTWIGSITFKNHAAINTTITNGTGSTGGPPPPPSGIATATFPDGTLSTTNVYFGGPSNDTILLNFPTHGVAFGLNNLVGSGTAAFQPGTYTLDPTSFANAGGASGIVFAGIASLEYATDYTGGSGQLTIQSMANGVITGTFYFTGALQYSASTYSVQQGTFTIPIPTSRAVPSNNSKARPSKLLVR